jgi:photosystem II biogenesis protein Psp29
MLAVEKVRTVSDSKREFYRHYSRPINSIYRRVVEELLVEMHLLSVNVDFRKNPIYSLGVVTSFERFMQGYQPEKDREAIFQALCLSVGGEAGQYRQEAERLLNFAKNKSIDDLITWLGNPSSTVGLEGIWEAIGQIVNNSNFKYSRLFAIGAYTLLEASAENELKEETKYKEYLSRVANNLHLPEDKLQKDLELYRSNLDKMVQVLSAMEDTLEATRKQREKREQQQNSSAQ